MDDGLVLLKRLQIRHPDLLSFMYPGSLSGDFKNSIEWRFNDGTRLIQIWDWRQDTEFSQKAFAQVEQLSDENLSDAMVSRSFITLEYYQKLWVDFYSDFIQQNRKTKAGDDGR